MKNKLNTLLGKHIRLHEGEEVLAHPHIKSLKEKQFLCEAIHNPVKMKVGKPIITKAVRDHLLTLLKDTIQNSISCLPDKHKRFINQDNLLKCVDNNITQTAENKYFIQEGVYSIKEIVSSTIHAPSQYTSIKLVNIHNKDIVVALQYKELANLLMKVIEEKDQIENNHANFQCTVCKRKQSDFNAGYCQSCGNIVKVIEF